MNWILLEAQYTIEYHQQKFDILQMQIRYNIVKRLDI